MDRQFQNRLVGTIVLVALGVIILPDLLDGKKNHVVEEFTEIPLKPMNVVTEEPNQQPESFEVINIAKGKDLGGATTTSEHVTEAKAQVVKAKATETKVVKHKVAETKTVKTKAQPKHVTHKPVTHTTKAPVKKATPKVEHAASTAKAGYTLQLGGFKSAQNVSALIAQLRLSGYTAYTVPATPVDGHITRVFVGPDTNQHKLTQARDPIKKLTGLNGKVIPFNPAG